LGLAKISADVREGSRRDAILYAVGANASHGLKRTNRDKRNAVMVLLKDPEWGRRQDVRTADQIAAALALIRQSDERWHGLTVWLSHSGMDRDAELLDRLAARAELWRNLGDEVVRRRCVMSAR
jgi:hypothetical protein